MNAHALPLLQSVVENLHAAAADSGLCFHRSAALVLDLKWADFVVGTVRAATPDEIEAEPRASRVPFLHAWVERGQMVYSPTLMEQHGGLLPLDRQDYYQANGVRDVYRMNRRELKRLAAVHRWTRQSVFGQRLAGAPSLPNVLLTEMGVPHRIEAGVALPLESADLAAADYWWKD